MMKVIVRRVSFITRCCVFSEYKKPYTYIITSRLMILAANRITIRIRANHQPITVIININSTTSASAHLRYEHM